jgi:hypothetical protein
MPQTANFAICPIFDVFDALSKKRMYIVIAINGKGVFTAPAQQAVKRNYRILPGQTIIGRDIYHLYGASGFNGAPAEWIAIIVHNDNIFAIVHD